MARVLGAACILGGFVLGALGAGVAAAEPARIVVVDVGGLTPGEISAVGDHPPSTLILSGEPAVRRAPVYELVGLGPDLVRSRGVDAAPVSRLCGEVQDLAALQTALDDAWFFADLEAAGEVLAKMETAAVCGGARLSKKELGLLYFHKGVEAVHSGAADGLAAFHAAMNIWPALPYPADENSDVKRVFDQARADLMASPNVRIKVNARQVGEGILLVDGDPVEAPELMLVGGPHLVQLSVGGGAILHGEIVQVAPTPGGEPLSWPPPRLRILDAAGLEAGLRTELNEPRPGDLSQAVAAALIAEGEAGWVVFTGLPTEATIKARWMGPRGFISDQALPREKDTPDVFSPRSDPRGSSHAAREPRPGGRRVAPALTVSFSILAAGSAGIYAGLYRYVDRQVFIDRAQAERAVTAGLTAEGVAIGAAAAAVTSGILTLATRGRAGEPWAVRPTVGISGDGERLALGLAVGGAF